MTIALHGRTVQVLLRSNNGASYSTVPKEAPNEIDISSYLVDLGDISWSVDDQLTKMSLGSISLTLTDDPAETIWTFLTESLDSSYGLLPPWIIVIVDGTPVFKGLVKESPSRSQDSGSLEISIQATDWSAMLDLVSLGAPQRFVSQAEIEGASTFVACHSYTGVNIAGGAGRNVVIVNAGSTAGLTKGRWLCVSNFSTYTNFGLNYIIDQVVFDSSNNAYVYLGSGFSWPSLAAASTAFHTSTCYLISSATTMIDVVANPIEYTVAFAWTPAITGQTRNYIKLDTVAGLYPGDVLEHKGSLTDKEDSGFTVTILDVDVPNSTIYLATPLEKAFTTSTTFWLSETSASEQYLTTLESILDRATTNVQLCTIDYSNYSPGILSEPSFGFISSTSPTMPPRTSYHENITSVSEIKAWSGTEFYLQNASALSQGWKGNPSMGWETVTWNNFAPWNNQVTTLADGLMPRLTAPDGVTYAQRTMTKYAGLDDGTTNKNVDGRIDTDRGEAAYKWVYDYSNNRVYKFSWYAGAAFAVVHWNTATSTWDPITGWASSFAAAGRALDICPMPGSTSCVTHDGKTGNGLVSILVTGQAKLFYSTADQTITLDGSECTRLNAKKDLIQLVQTPSSVYYLTPTGYGRIWMDGAVMKSKWMQIYAPAGTPGAATVTPLTNTFTEAHGRIWTLAKVSYKADGATTPTDELYLIQLPLVIPDSPSEALIRADYIGPNISRTTALAKNPGTNDLLGCVGAKLFQVSYTLPTVIERFSPEGETIASILEYMGAVTNTICHPTVDGKVKLHTRGFNPSPTVNLTIDTVSITESVWNPTMSDCIVIKGKDCEEYAVSETQKSGLTISYENEMFIRNSSQARALAYTYLEFFEKPRKLLEMVWYSQTNPTQWESLEPMDIVTINGDPQEYYLTALSWNYNTRSATASLLEVV